MKDLRIKHESLVRMNELKPKDWALLHSYNEKKKKTSSITRILVSAGPKICVAQFIAHLFFLVSFSWEKLENT